jgi:hypothetical protein
MIFDRSERFFTRWNELGVALFSSAAKLFEVMRLRPHLAPLLGQGRNPMAVLLSFPVVTARAVATGGCAAFCRVPMRPYPGCTGRSPVASAGLARRLLLIWRTSPRLRRGGHQAEVVPDGAYAWNHTCDDRGLLRACHHLPAAHRSPWGHRPQQRPALPARAPSRRASRLRTACLHGCRARASGYRLATASSWPR